VSPPVPAPRTPASYRLAVVCLGNICRSPIADVVLNERVREAGLDDAVEVISAGTGDWHVGEPMDRRAPEDPPTKG
jgi:protein-tyrosine phosphatase